MSLQYWVHQLIHFEHIHNCTRLCKQTRHTQHNKNNNKLDIDRHQLPSFSNELVRKNHCDSNGDNINNIFSHRRHHHYLSQRQKAFISSTSNPRSHPRPCYLSSRGDQHLVTCWLTFLSHSGLTWRHLTKAQPSCAANLRIYHSWRREGREGTRRSDHTSKEKLITHHKTGKSLKEGNMNKLRGRK